MASALTRQMQLSVLFTSNGAKFITDMRAGTTAVGKFGGAVTKLGQTFRSLASYMVAGAVIYNFINALRKGTKEIIDFSQALKNLQAITGASDAQIVAMGDKIKQLAVTTKFSAAEIANGMVLLGQSGFTAEESISAIQATAELATGTLSSMQTTADLLTTTIRAFGLEATESGRVSDVMANAVNKSKLTIDKLRIAFNFVGAAAAQAGLSLEETTATMMNLANNGLRASTIGTGMRQVLSRLISPNAKLREAYRQQGVDLREVNPLTVGYTKALKNLSIALWDSEKGTIDMAKAYSLFGLRGAQAVAVIVKSFKSGAYQDSLDKVFEVGTAAEMAGIQAEGLGVKFKNLADRFGALFISLGEAGLADLIGDFVDGMRNLIETIRQFISTESGQFALRVGAMTVSLLAISQIIVVLIPYIKSFIASLALANPIVAVVTAAIIGLATGLSYLSVKYKDAGFQGKKYHEELAKISITQKANLDSLTSYVEQFNTLIAVNKKGTDVTREYESLLKRLIIDHPELKDKIDLTATSLEGMRDSLHNIILEDATNHFKSLKNEADAYSKAANDAKDATFGWNKDLADFKMTGFKNMFINIEYDFKEMIEGLKELWAAFINSIIDNNTNVFPRTEDGFFGSLLDKIPLRRKWEDWAKSQRIDLGGSLKERTDALNIERQSKLEGNRYTPIVPGEDTKKLEIEQERRLQDVVNIATKAKISASDLKNILSTQGWEGWEIEEIVKRMGQLQEKTDALAEDLKGKLPELPKLFSDLYKQVTADQILALDGLRKSYMSKLEAIRKDMESQKLSGTKEEAIRLAALEKETHIKGLELIKQRETEKIQERLRILKKEMGKYSSSLKKFDVIDPTVENDFKAKIATIKEEINILFEEFSKIKGFNEDDLSELSGVSQLQKGVEGVEEALTKLSKKEEKLGVKSTAERFNEAYKSMAETFRQMPVTMVDRFADSLANLVSGTESLSEAFRNMAASIVADLTKMIIKMLAYKYLAEALGLATGSGDGGILSKGSGGGDASLGIGAGELSASKLTAPTIANPMAGFKMPALAMGGAGSGMGMGQQPNYIININATDASSFANMLRTKPAQEMIASSITTKFGHNAPIRKQIRR